MKYLLLLLSLCLFNKSDMKKIYEFTPETNTNQWRIVNDDVMGGVSKSSLLLTESGYGKFSGYVSLLNNGGFASIQLNTSIRLLKEDKYILLRIKGDGKAYEFRLKSKISQYESYVHQFSTTKEWQIIKLPLSEFYPQFRGRKLNISNFNFDNIEQLSFLISNKQEEEFTLLINWISLE